MKIKFLWAEYDFSYTPKLLDEEGGMCFGICDNKDQVIRVEEIVSKDRKRVAAIHEVLHALSYLNGLGLTEDQVQGISHQLYTVMLQNPELIQHMIPHVERNK